MKDYLGNDVNEGDMVVIAIKVGKYASLGRAVVLKTELRKQYEYGMPTNMVHVEWSSIHKYWLPARNVIKLSDDMLPEKRKEKLDNVSEGVRVSKL